MVTTFFKQYVYVKENLYLSLSLSLSISIDKEIVVQSCWGSYGTCSLVFCSSLFCFYNGQWQWFFSSVVAVLLCGNEAMLPATCN